MISLSNVTLRLAVTSAILFILGGCVSGLKVEPVGVNHPANPQAEAAPVAQLPDTLNVKSIELPQQEDDPHASHNM